ncbi:transcriptional corepressor hairless [Arctopsyche grandis]|uniref:transcriptional corepressor hairless n=1 Tax=Arctopsyche grandis TaxID=121162 RepID=UPI00406D840A
MTEAAALNGDARSPKPPRAAPPPPNAPPPPPPHTPATHGGRLKFFKDGKFILELARAHDAWVSVPRRTFWPPTPHSAAPAPPPPTSTPPAAAPQNHERAPSLSVSDDNSSIQSSPWQRDHCWKQSTPQRGLSKELTGLYLRPVELPPALLMMPSARRKRRRPFDVTLVTLPNGLPVHTSNGTGSHSPENCSDEVDNGRKVNSPALDDHKSAPLEKHVGKFKFFKHSSEPVRGRVTYRVYKKSKKFKKRKELCKIVDTLNDKLAAQPVSVTAKLSSAFNCKQDAAHMMVSPRKRILREFERVSLEDKANKRPRSRNTTVLPKAGPSTLENCTAVVSIPPPTHQNGTQQHHHTPRREPSTSKPGSSYSINSLLSMSEESPPRRSPEVYHPKKSSQMHGFIKTESPVSIHSPDLSSSPDVMERQRSVRPLTAYMPHSFTPPSHAGYASASPRPMDKFYQESYTNPEDPSQIPYQVCIPPPYLPSTAYLTPMYPPYSPRTPAPLWPHYPVMPPGIWAPLPHPLLTDHMPREDTSSDVPLNLSKH